MVFPIILDRIPGAKSVAIPTIAPAPDSRELSRLAWPTAMGAFEGFLPFRPGEKEESLGNLSPIFTKGKRRNCR
jgi:hypothetical protein